MAVQADLTKRQDILRMFQDIDRVTDKVDIVINCAGLGGMTPVVQDADEDIVEAVLGVNLRAPYYIAVEGAKRMPDGGRIVNFSQQRRPLHLPGLLHVRRRQGGGGDLHQGLGQGTRCGASPSTP